MVIKIEELKPGLWPDLEKLFGSRGACGGCWCMSWRLPKGEKWADVKGQKNRQRFRSLVKGGKAHGAIAYVAEEPVGWVSFDRRTEYDRLNRAPSLACDDAERVWAVPCFFIKTGFRGQGIASRLLREAVRILKRRGVRIMEGYPVKPWKSGERIPGAFAWTGTIPVFQKAGFKPVGPRDGGRQRMRKTFA
ncbi:MAG: GNAT family N-acetyltransferase [Pseudomonadota bacterium]